jgi:hypothetical protein
VRVTQRSDERGGAACPQDAMGALETTRTTNVTSFCKVQ